MHDVLPGVRYWYCDCSHHVRVLVHTYRCAASVHTYCCTAAVLLYVILVCIPGTKYYTMDHVMLLTRVNPTGLSVLSLYEFFFCSTGIPPSIPVAVTIQRINLPIIFFYFFIISHNNVLGIFSDLLLPLSGFTERCLPSSFLFPALFLQSHIDTRTISCLCFSLSHAPPAVSRSSSESSLCPVGAHQPSSHHQRVGEVRRAHAWVSVCVYPQGLVCARMYRELC